MVGNSFKMNINTPFTLPACMDIVLQVYIHMYVYSGKYVWYFYSHSSGVVEKSCDARFITIASMPGPSPTVTVPTLAATAPTASSATSSKPLG